MRFLKGALPNISIALTLALMVVVYLDRRNPMMGFLSGAPFFVLALLAGIASIATSVVLYCDWRSHKKPKRKAEKVTNNT
jgi:hypothetical protein